MEIINQDLLLITKGAICHQTNCMGAMGGLAGDIKNKYPIVYKEYLAYLNGLEHKRQALGTIQYVIINKDLSVLNLFGQYTYGKGRRTDYDALRLIVKELEQLPLSKQQELYFPYMFGCNRGGGDWNIVQDIFSNLNSYWCKL